MEQKQVPLGFGMALAQNPEAMDAFARMPEAKRSQVLEKAHSVSSKSEMQALVNSLSAQG